MIGCHSPGPGWAEAPATADPEPRGSRTLQQYKESYYQQLGREITGTITRDTLLERVRSARVLWLGDHHSDERLHARHLQLLGELIARGVLPVLMLEAIGIEDAFTVQSFVAEQITMTEMKRLLAERARNAWLVSEGQGIDARYYNELLQLARQHALPVFGIEPIPRLPLEQRDGVIADHVKSVADRHPDRLILVVVGSAHLLGQGNLIGRVGLPQVAIGSRLSTRLQLSAKAWQPKADELLCSSSGVLFFPQD